MIGVFGVDMHHHAVIVINSGGIGLPALLGEVQTRLMDGFQTDRIHSFNGGPLTAGAPGLS